MAARPFHRALARLRRWPWLWALLWMAGQQGALWHPLQHLQAGDPSYHAAHAGHDHDAAADVGCSLCLALASLGAAAPVASAVVVARLPASALAVATAPLGPRTALTAQHNRGPPAAA